MTETDLVVRRASIDDFPGIVELARRALGWSDDDAAFLSWKHLDNPYGVSPMWVALDGARIAGFRTFMRWEFRFPGGDVVRAVRAVDTATDPDYQGRGIFTRLTLQGIDELAAEGVKLVFNTPNDKSLPGYLKMGWAELGRLPAAVMPTRLRFFRVLHTARTAAGRWPVPTELGDAAPDAFADRAVLDAVGDLLATQPAAQGIVTRRTPELFAWRYGFPPLGYRVLALPTGLADGFAVIRRRQRGDAIECVLCDTVVPGGDERLAGRLVRDIRARAECDYIIRLDHRRLATGPFVRLPRIGPVLACRPLDGSPPPALERWQLSMGDVELF
ncbi:MAG TPA: GNAT family N-acetyltransferase [Acidimicrobiia bacterium]|jgi:GNAT superfamily N-acetyltransferase